MTVLGWPFWHLGPSMISAEPCGLSALPISGTVAELMIGHKQRGIRAVYDRFAYLDEQRSGFELWAARVRDLVEPPPPNVVVLREAGH